jgi:hypothetical protein
MVERTREERTNEETTNEEAKGRGTWDFLTASLVIVVAGIASVSLLALAALMLVSKAAEANVDAMVSVLTAGTGVIGTLVGSFLGLKLGTEDKGRIQDQAEQYRREADHLMRALAVLPADQARAVLREVAEARRSGPSPKNPRSDQ